MDTQTTSCTHHSQLASNAMSAPNFRRKEEFTHNSCFTHWFVPDSVPSRHNSSQIGSGEQNESTNHYNPVLCAATTPKHRFCHHCWLFLLPAMPFFWKVGEHFKEIMSLANQDHFFPLFKPPSFRAPPRRTGWGVHVWSWCLQLDLHTGCHILLTILTNALLFTGNQQRKKKTTTEDEKSRESLWERMDSEGQAMVIQAWRGSLLSSNNHLLFPHKLSIWPPGGIVLTGGVPSNLSLIPLTSNQINVICSVWFAANISHRQWTCAIYSVWGSCSESISLSLRY